MGVLLSGSVARASLTPGCCGRNGVAILERAGVDGEW
jgi:hypothetical protein